MIFTIKRDTFAKQHFTNDPCNGEVSWLLWGGHEFSSIIYMSFRLHRAESSCKQTIYWGFQSYHLRVSWMHQEITGRQHQIKRYFWSFTFKLLNKRKIFTCCYNKHVLSRWGETMSLNCNRQRGYCSSPKVINGHGQPRWDDTERRKPKLGLKLVPVQFCPPQIPYGETRGWNRDEVRGRRLTAWAKARPLQLGDHELASGNWREGEVLFPL
jgi:hypothetical protein